ncbi:MAG TPA: alpha/beta hydrolase [Urbifossiella sp.]|nr:alpha/beta hydrolase [Urbifossiella sp.]
MTSRFLGLVAAVSGLMVAATASGRPDPAPEKKTFRAADGVTVVGDVRGQGETTIVFLHGWCGDRAYWKHQVDEFAKGYRVVAIDQAGHGESGKDRRAWSAEGLAGDVEAVVKALDAKRVILVGHSMGGPVSLLAAKRMPGTVVAVVGVDTLQNAEFKMPAEVVNKLVGDFEKDFKGTMRAGFVTGLLPENADRDLKNWLTTRAEAQDQKMAVALIHDLLTFDTAKALKEARTPVRCINSGGGFMYFQLGRGQQEILNRRGINSGGGFMYFQPTAADVNKKYADYKVVTVDAVGHYPMLEKPAEFNKALRGVLEEFARKP